MTLSFFVGMISVNLSPSMEGSLQIDTSMSPFSFNLSPVCIFWVDLMSPFAGKGLWNISGHLESCETYNNVCTVYSVHLFSSMDIG